MKYGLLAAFGVAGVVVVWLTFVGEAASIEIGGAYMVASLLALIVTRFATSWSVAIKWVWVALSLVMIFAIVTGPLDYLQLS